MVALSGGLQRMIPIDLRIIGGVSSGSSKSNNSPANPQLEGAHPRPASGMLSEPHKLTARRVMIQADRGWLFRYDDFVISTRSLMSLCQYFEIQRQERTELILNKHGIETPDLQAWGHPECSYIGRIQDWLREARQESMEQVLAEIVRTQGSFYRYRDSNVQTYRERYQDLIACLTLDGYVVNGSELLLAEPNLDGQVIEDDLTREVQRSGLAEANDILQRLNSSAEDFRRAPPDLNGALTNARVALQTLGTSISTQHAGTRPAGFDGTKWGKVVTHLRTAGVITLEEERGLAGVFGFVSPGAHVIVGLSEMEMVRLGRSLVVSMCYFLAKRWNG